MSISFDGALEVMSLDVQDLIGLSEEEVQEKVTEAIPDLSASEIEGFMEDLRARLSEIEDELHELMDGYEEDIDEAEDNDNTESAARYESRLEECQEALDAIDEIEDAALEVTEHEMLLNVETDQDYSLAYDTNELNQINDGDVMNITCLAGSQSGVFEEEETDPAETAVDLNGDGILNYDELNATSTTELASGQNVFFQINSGDSISLISSTDAYASFLVTTKDGKSFTVNIEGDANIYFEGAGYLDSNILSSWPEELLKRCYDNNDSVSFYGHVYEDAEAGDDARLSAIEGYDDITSQSTLDVIWSDTYNKGEKVYGTIKTSADAKPYYDSAMEMLFGYIDGTLTDAESISEVWAQIFQEWTAAGLKDADFSTLISNIVMGVALGGDQLLFQSLFAPVITTLENYMPNAKDNLSKLDKLTILLLETQSGAIGLYGGTGIWNTAFAHEGENGLVEGEFKNIDENKSVINMYETFIAQTGWALLSGSEDEARDNEIALEEQRLAAEESGENEEVPDEWTETDVSTLKAAAGTEFAKIFGTTGGVFTNDGITQETLETHLKNLIDGINGLLLQGATAQDIANYIVNTIGDMSTAHQDNVAAALSALLFEEDNSLWQSLKACSGFKDSMWRFIDSGNGDKPCGNNTDPYDKDWFENQYGKEF